MKVKHCGFGEPEIDSEIFVKDILIDRGEIKKRKKKKSNPYREHFGHTPLLIPVDDSPWARLQFFLSIINSGKPDQAGAFSPGGGQRPGIRSDLHYYYGGMAVYDH
jgi:hypothetical protein